MFQKGESLRIFGHEQLNGDSQYSKMLQTLCTTGCRSIKIYDL